MKSRSRTAKGDRAQAKCKSELAMVDWSDDHKTVSFDVSWLLHGSVSETLIAGTHGKQGWSWYLRNRCSFPINRCPRWCEVRSLRLRKNEQLGMSRLSNNIQTPSTTPHHVRRYPYEQHQHPLSKTASSTVARFMRYVDKRSLVYTDESCEDDGCGSSLIIKINVA